MFSHLVESAHHRGELKRTGSFFLLTMVAYALVLMAAGVVGVFAYEAQIDDQNLVLVSLVPPEMDEPKPPEARQRPTQTTAPANTGSQQRDTAGLIKNTPPENVSTDPTIFSGTPKGATTQSPPVLSSGTGINENLIPGNGNPYGKDGGGGSNLSGTPSGNNAGGIIAEEPPKLEKKPAPPQKIPYIGPVNSQALSLPEPVYPQVAKLAGVQGPVAVEILIDEQGRVISAHATSGNPLLRVEAERAARRARFSPTMLQNQPVKAKGVITFNFVLRK